MFKTGFYFILCIQICLAYENLALQKKTWQRTSCCSNNPNISRAANAVDGNSDQHYEKKSCAISAEKQQTAEWRVDLGSILSIHHVKIFFRTENTWETTFKTRNHGFYLYVSNTTNKEDGYLCFHDPPNVKNVTRTNCIRYGKYVILYNKIDRSINSSSPFLELCEVKVFGCPNNGYYGKDCNITCPQNCQDHRCNIADGICLGCIVGYKGQECEQECSEGYYGLECRQKCSGNCRTGSKCDHISGSCTGGCKPGWRGVKCNAKCSEGYYGLECGERCSGNCRTGSKCDHISGSCTGGCEPGWKGDKCNEKCDGHMYGKNCSEHCGKCRNNTQCHHLNGTCFSGCIRGFQGNRCNKECDKGWYGLECSRKCSVNCKTSEECDHVTGKCNNGCAQGWKDHRCNNVCDRSMYGQNCSYQCGYCRNNTQCHHVNGTCLSGCDKGYQGKGCSKVCDRTFYGEDCRFNCSLNCINRTCNAVSGECIEFIVAYPIIQATDISAIIGTVAVVLLAVIGVILFNIRRKCAREQRSQQSSTTNHPEPGRGNHAIEQYANITVNDDNEEEIPKRPIDGKTDNPSRSASFDEVLCRENIYNNDILDLKIADLQKLITQDRKYGFASIKAEFAVLPYGIKSPCEVGKLKENIPKNRFKTTFPYDHSRVVLKAVRGHAEDYINANYIDGVLEEKIYIATQGPKPNTISHFWRMVWQENVKQIVMLTNLKEDIQVATDKVKCAQYWPDLTQDIAIGQLTVRNVDEKEYAFFVKRTFAVTSSRETKTREVTQYHYTAWPDHGTPDPLCLVIFQKHVMSTESIEESHHIVVHCSAGIGRTGTYIALDALYKNGLNTGSVNVAEYVKKMRRDRMNMVQTPEQYLTIFLCIDEAFKVSVKSVKTSDFVDGSTKILTDSVLRKEVQTLQKIAPHYENSHFQNAMQQTGIQEPHSILPLDKYCLYLTSTVANRGNYINAITVPSYSKRECFIITLYPSENTVVDFIRLLIDYQSTTVVCMDPLEDIESTDFWFPKKSGCKNIDPFVVTHETTTVDNTSVETTMIQVKNKMIKMRPTTVSVLQPKYRIKDTSQILALTTALLKCGVKGPVTIISKDGASFCGLYCAVFNVLQQIKCDNEVDIFTVVRQLQVRRPQLCSSFNEYKLCYQAVKEYILRDNTDNLYANQ